jgi:hypothetical protein
MLQSATDVARSSDTGQRNSCVRQVKRSSPQAAVASSEDNVTLSRSRRRTSSNDASIVGGRHSRGATSEPERRLDELNGWLIRLQILIAGLIAHDERDARYERDARSADRQ